MIFKASAANALIGGIKQQSATIWRHNPDKDELSPFDHLLLVTIELYPHLIDNG